VIVDHVIHVHDCWHDAAESMNRIHQRRAVTPYRVEELAAEGTID